MLPHPKFIKRNPIKTQVDDRDYKMFATMAEFNGLTVAELARLFIKEGMDRRTRKQGQYDHQNRA